MGKASVLGQLVVALALVLGRGGVGVMRDFCKVPMQPNKQLNAKFLKIKNCKALIFKMSIELPIGLHWDFAKIHAPRPARPAPTPVPAPNHFPGTKT